MDYKLSAKRVDSGKWYTFGTFKKNKFGNLQASLRISAELKALINSKEEGQWINFSAFENEPKREVTPETQATLDKMYAEDAKEKSSITDDEIPF